MAEEKKLKIGDLEFATEQEYNEAAGDLKKIKDIMEKYNINDPAQAGKILASIHAHPETFRSPYGKKFVERLEKVTGADSTQNTVQKSKAKTKKNAKAPKPKKASKQGKADGIKKPGLQIFTARNFAIGIVIIVAVIALSLFAPQLFSVTNQKSGSGDIQRNMVTAYAKGQAELKAQLYTYYFDVMGESETEASTDAAKAIADNYVMDLSDSSISRMSASQIEEVYDQLVDGGDIQNNSFVEPKGITLLREKLLSAGLSGNTGNGTAGEADETAVINSMMDYQEQLFYALSYEYSLLKYGKDDCEAFANEDMESMFTDVIYSYSLTEEEKQTYYQNYVERGLIQGSRILRFSSNPKEYGLPELTPNIQIFVQGQEEAYQCSMLSYAPAASVFYQFHSESDSGYLCFRNNGRDTNYIELEDGTTVTCQGDFYMVRGADFIGGQWFYNGNDFGLLLNGEHDSVIRCVNDLTY